MSVTAHRTSLAQLAATIQREDALAQQAGRSMVNHAIRAGEALLEAREQIPWGGFEAWLAEHFKHGKSRAYDYIRLAENKDDTATAPSINAALALVAGRPIENPKATPLSPLKRQVRDLAAQGLDVPEIMERLGVTKAVVAGHLVDPERKKEYSRRYDARKRADKRQRTTIKAARELLNATVDRLLELRDQASDDDLRDVLDELAGQVATSQQWLDDALEGRR